MTDDQPPPAPEARRSHLIDLTPLRVSPAYARLWAGNTLAGIGSMLTTTAVGLHIYELTSSTFMVSLVAWFALGPMVVAGLYGGAVADRFDRRAVALVASLVAWTTTLVLATLAWADITVVGVFYAVTTVSAVAATVASATRQAITPRLLPAHLLPQAAALGGVSAGLMVTAGPALAGLLVARVGFAWTYTIDVLLFLAGFFGLWMLPEIRPERTADGVQPSRGLSSVREGLAHLRRWPNVRMSFVVDLVAMTFGQPIVLFPAVGAVVIGGGPVTVGILMASYAVGTILVGLVSGRLTRLRHHGRAVRDAIVVYGAAILALGVVLAVTMLGGHAVASTDLAEAYRPALVAAVACLVVAGGADQVSAIFRTAILQSAVPDSLRGRMQGVFTVVVTGGPRLGQMFAGTVATLTTTWFAPLVGGALVIVLVVVAVARVASFRDYDAAHPQP